MADSNTDWGQTLKALAAYQKENDLGRVKLSQFTFLDPAIYGVVYEPIAPMQGAPPVLPRRFNPAPGLYAISATTLDGVPLPLPSTFDWFRHREPFAKIGYAMFLYEVEPGSVTPATEATPWVAQCTVPAPSLPSDVVAQGFGSNALRQIYFDCERSWIFPDGGQTSGWYVYAPVENIDKLAGLGDFDSCGYLRCLWGAQRPRKPMVEHIDWLPDWIQWEGLLSVDNVSSVEGALSIKGGGQVRLSYVQSAPGELSPFTIWTWEPREFDAPAIVGAPTMAGARYGNRAYILGGVLMFLGQVSPLSVGPGVTVDVLTYWRVLTPPDRSLSLMLHLSESVGHPPIAVGDGLGVPLDQWQEGDIIVQRHSLAIPMEAPLGVYQLVSGAYWVDAPHAAGGLTHLTWEGEDADAEGGNFMVLGEITIR